MKNGESKHERTAQVQPNQKILDALQGIRYGSVEIVIHDGRVVQIERREKIRLESSD